MIDGDWNRAAGGGAHATLSAFDMHNTLVAAGPDLKQGMVDQLPSGNIDLVPTILHLLHVDTSQKFDGRILSEALVHPSAIPDKVKEESLEARRDLGEYSWRQYLKISHMGSTTYLDEGNGSSRPILRP
jgi:arylsulfatase A-like enzyme